MAKVLLRNIRAGKRKAAIADLNSIARKEIEKSLDTKVKPALVKSHNMIVASWKHKPGFKARKFIKPNEISINVFPTGPNKKIWIFVDKGTKPHPMPAVTGKIMAFRAGGKYQPKTLAKPARTVSGGGKVTGGTKIVVKSRKEFTHPGSEPRNFTKQIAEDIKPGFKREIDNTFRRVARLVEE